mmetsp:Transcript_14119/g.23953  ORF Transcript_14119/g.23953 Transcript_14119/m.23953 type:complete len:195 (+) Transcript_14119:3-587(+)
MAKTELKVWIRFNLFWMHAPIPVLLVRYEDLISDVEGEMRRVMQFMSPEPLSTFSQDRIKHVCGNGRDPSELGSYRPRAATGRSSIGKSIAKNRYDDHLLRDLHSIATSEEGYEGSSLLEFFAYDCFSQQFPLNFESHQVLPLSPKYLPGSTTRMDINTGTSVRPVDDPYGRFFKRWRMERTNNDQDPFPTIAL